VSSTQARARFVRAAHGPTEESETLMLEAVGDSPLRSAALSSTGFSALSAEFLPRGARAWNEEAAGYEERRAALSPSRTARDVLSRLPSCDSLVTSRAVVDSARAVAHGSALTFPSPYGMLRTLAVA